MFATPALAAGRGTGLVGFGAGSVAPTSSGKIASGPAGGGMSGFAAASGVSAGEPAGTGWVCAARAGRAARGGRGLAGGVAAGRSIPGGSGQITLLLGAAPCAEAVLTPAPLIHTTAPKETSAHAHTLTYRLPLMTIPLDATRTARTEAAGPAPMAQF
jgi:hypothetical protein